MTDDLPRDEDLVAAAAAGARDAFEVLVRRHWRRLFHVALGILHDPRDAEDVAQEAWMNAWRGLAGFRGDARPATWLVGITTRAAIDRLRQRRRREGPLSPVPVEDMADLLADPRTGPAALPGEDGRFDAVLRRARAVLSPRQLAVFELKAGQDLSFEEIARAVGCGESSARQHFFRAVHRLRAELEAAS